MAYKCRIYEKSNFSAANMPLDISIVDTYASAYHDVDVLTIVQQKFLDSIDIKTTWQDVNNVDYCVLYKGTSPTNPTSGTLFCYFVTDATMVAEDVAKLTLVPDYITSAGGFNNITIISGITRRSTRAFFDVNPEDMPTDSYIAPALPLKLETEWNGLRGTEQVFVQSTLELAEMGLNYRGSSPCPALSAVDGQGEKVTVPLPNSISYNDYVSYELDNNSVKYPISVFRLNDPNNTNPPAMDGINLARALGIENAISNSWVVDNTFVTIGNYSAATGKVFELEGVKGDITSSNIILAVCPNIFTTSDNAEIHPYIQAVLNYSEYMPFTIVTASGDSISASPKDLFAYSGGKVVISYSADPRPDGKPYFRFKYLNTASEETGGRWWRNTISGLPWKQNPMVFTTAQGSALNSLQFNASRNIANAAAESSLRSISGDLEVAKTQRNIANARALMEYNLGHIRNSMEYAAGGATMVAGVGVGDLKGVGAGALQIANAGFSEYANAARTGFEITANNTRIPEYQSGIAFGNLSRNYEAQKAADILNYDIQQNIVEPAIMFPYSAEPLRDFYGNGILITRSVYQTQDFKRIAKILKAFGVEYTRETQKADFIPHGNMTYAYVDANVQVGNLPKWMAEGVSAQISGGVRVWKEKPKTITI